jgi:opacity protein-like surface antigen
LKNQMKTSKQTLIVAGLALSSAFLATGSVLASDATNAAKEKVTRETQESSWYVQGLIGQAFSSNQDLTVRLGGPVALNGTASYGHGPAFSVALGKQWLGSKRKEEKDAAGKPASEKCPQADHELSNAEPKRLSPQEDDCLPWRAEVEFWSSTAKREAVNVGSLSAKPGDSVRASVVFLNGAFRLSESEELKANLLPTWRAWLGGGVGYGRVSYPGAFLSSGCDCLAAVSDSGLAAQVKFMIERQVSEKTQLVLQVGHVWLPKISTANGQFPQTQWQARHVNQLSVGLRHSFQ